MQRVFANTWKTFYTIMWVANNRVRLWGTIFVAEM